MGNPVTDAVLTFQVWLKERLGSINPTVPHLIG